jgi:type IV pilus assembly protein PilC
MAFTRQLATLLSAGMPLLRSLRTLREQSESSALKQVLDQVGERIENGGSLAEALAEHPRVFSGLYQNMVKAGEISGALDTALERLADFIERSHRLRGKIKAALFYPAAVIVVAGGILFLLMTQVVPRFQAIFADLLNGASFPAFTRFVFGLSDLLRLQVWWVLVLTGALAATVTLVAHTFWGRWMLDRMWLSLPLVGPLLRKIAISRLCRTLGTLVSSGVPILQALTIVRETVGNVHYGKAVLEMHEQVKEGEPLAPGFKRAGLFPAMVGGMVDVGEQTGALPEMLKKIADVYDEEVESATTALTSLLEPLMIVFLAVVVGSIVIAMFLPLIHITTHGLDPAGDRAE